MSKAIGLEDLKEALASSDRHIAVAKVTDLSLAPDRSFLRCTVNVWPEEREMVARMTWDVVGPSSGVFAFPVVGDLVLVAFADGHPDYCFVIKRLTSIDDKIPVQAVDGSTAIVALSGKKLWLSSTSKINLSKGSTAPTEPLALGNVLAEFLGKILDEFLNAPQIGIHPLGPVFLDPTIRANLVAHKSTYITTAATNILSQLSFTERGN